MRFKKIKQPFGALALRRIGNQVKILDEPITVRDEQTTKTTVLNGKVWLAMTPKSGDLPMDRFT
jgi:hypothetical protein